jgi:hypothetical protein
MGLSESGRMLLLLLLLKVLHATTRVRGAAAASLEADVNRFPRSARGAAPGRPPPPVLLTIVDDMIVVVLDIIIAHAAITAAPACGWRDIVILSPVQPGQDGIGVIIRQGVGGDFRREHRRHDPPPDVFVVVVGRSRLDRPPLSKDGAYPHRSRPAVVFIAAFVVVAAIAVVEARRETVQDLPSRRSSSTTTTTTTTNFVFPVRRSLV